MYPEELKKFIEERNKKLGGKDLLKATSPQENPQLNHIMYNSFENKYQMWDLYGNYYEFEPIPYKEYRKSKKL